MIRAQAIVDRVALNGGDSHLWKVHVSDPSHPHVRDYTVIADTEDDAAQQGIRKFCDELDPSPKFETPGG